MNRHGTDGVVDSKIFKRIHSGNDYHSGNSAKQDCAGWANPITRTGDRNQACEKTIRGVAGVPGLHLPIAIKDRSKAGSAGSQSRVRSNATDANKIHG